MKRFTLLIRSNQKVQLRASLTPDTWHLTPTLRIAEKHLSKQIIETTLRVRYAETDQMGIAYYANYLAWFEVGRTEWCRATGFTYREMEQLEGIYVRVADAHCRYKTPARYDDVLRIKTKINSFKKRLIVFGYEIYNQASGELLATGETTHTISDAQGHLRSLPEKYLRYFEA
ncbi:MAG: thioesterase family protein [Terriglobia bacterium]